jgi:uncharacterized protein (TIGR03435 family)
VDGTNLQGEFDFDLEFVSTRATEDVAGATIFTALKEQLGLSLQAGKRSVNVFFTDSADLIPTPN